jgi:hypothetical protein
MAGARIIRRRNPAAHAQELPFGEWVPAHAVKFNQDGTVEVMTESPAHAAAHNRGRRNIAAGFYDEDGYFHPIRASWDYSRSRAGEGPKRRKPAKRRRSR